MRPPVDYWREAAAGLYAGWMSYVAARKPMMIAS
jgi:hypothetical protein